MQGTTPERLGSGEMFDAIAPGYDRLNRILSLGIDRGWRRRAARALALPDAPCTVLDVATGTGDLAIEIAEQHPVATVVGVDPSAGMLSIGRDKLVARGLAQRVTLSEGTAEELPFETASFAGATIAFGIRNVPDRPRGLAEMARVVAPGGRVVVLELSEPRGALGAMARVHVHHVVPWLGGLLSGKKEYRYLQASIAAFPPAEEFAKLFPAAGLDVIEVVSLTFGVAHLYVAERRASAA